MKIAILDDQKEMVSVLKQKLFKYMKSEDVEIDTYWIQSKEDIPTQFYDVYLVDIEMPINGFQIASCLKKESKIVFVSIHHRLVYSCFQYNPYFFVRKEYLDDDLKGLCKKLQSERNDYHTKQNKRIDLNEIVKVQSEGNYVQFYFADGKSFLERITFTELSNEYHFQTFVLVKRGLMVNMKWIQWLDSTWIMLKNEECLKITLSRKKDVEKKYNEWRVDYYGK